MRYSVPFRSQPSALLLSQSRWTHPVVLLALERSSAAEKKAMYTEWVAPTKLLPARACPSTVLPFPSSKEEVAGHLARPAFRDAWRDAEAQSKPIPVTGGGGGRPCACAHRAWRGAEEREAGLPSAFSMSSSGPTRSMSRSTLPSTSSVASWRGRRRRQASSMQ